MQLKQRGTAKTIQDFLKEDIQNTNHPYCFDVKNAPELIRNAIARGEKITIIGDYDCDGVCASSILFTTLRLLGAKPAVRLPLRFAEGYGMNPKMVEEIPSGLVITVDNGITALEAVTAAKKKGLTVIVTDHHLPNQSADGKEIELPQADCLLDPHVEYLKNTRDKYDYYDYCGAGIALKLSEQLLDGHPVLDSLSAYAAVATIADVMPLTGENREIVRRGFTVIAQGRAPEGLDLLFRKNGIALGSYPDVSVIPPWAFITGDTIAFKIGPCINAPSRIIEHAGGPDERFAYVKEGGDGAKIAMNCLMAKGANAESLTDTLIQLNSERKSLVAEADNALEAYIFDHNLMDDNLIVAYLPDGKPGLMGPLAGHITERYNVPAIVLTGDGEMCYGSCRSVRDINIRDLLQQASSVLVNFGGHAGAAGVSLYADQIGALREILNRNCPERVPLDTETVEYDLKIHESEIAAVLDYSIRNLAPFGEGNLEPVFLIDDFTIQDFFPMSGGKHLKLRNAYADAIQFNADTEEIMSKYRKGDRVQLVGTLSYNWFRNSFSPQINFEAIL